METTQQSEVDSDIDSYSDFSSESDFGSTSEDDFQSESESDVELQYEMSQADSVADTPTSVADTSRNDEYEFDPHLVRGKDGIYFPISELVLKFYGNRHSTRQHSRMKRFFENEPYTGGGRLKNCNHF